MKALISNYSLYCIIYLTTTVLAYAPKSPIAYTKYGPIRGVTKYSRYFRDYDSYMGIPYAKPPINELRFKAPENPETWHFPLDATKEGPFCIQKNYFFANPKVEGQEDCLYLNVYVPKQTNKENNTLLPVMVYIHWGGFFAGRGTSDYLGPDYFMDKNIILVTFNYRLGVLGLLSTLDDASPGNYALKDQVAALKWVQENIENFGGDKNEVTIFGTSAGSASVHFHILSPQSKGLFKRAISESGTALNLWAKPQNELHKTVTNAQASFVGCNKYIGNNINLVNCLRSIDAVTLVASSDFFKYFSIEPINPFTAVIEEKTILNPNPFLTKEPIEYIKSGEFQRVPWIIGNNEDEGIIRASPLLRQSDTYKVLNSNFSELLPKMLALSLSVGENVQDLWQNITNFYLNNNEFINIENEKSVKSFIDLYSDRSFKYGIYQTILIHSMKQHTPIWFYNFNYRGKNSYGDLFAATQETINFTWGVSHCDEVLYLFKSPYLFPDLNNDNDISMSQKLLTIWTNFAIYGTPDPQEDLKWGKIEMKNKYGLNFNDNLHFLNINGSYKDDFINFTMEKGFLQERMSFWSNQTLLENF